jgi:hypothetical protein
MPTKLGEPYSPLWRGKYPQMLPEDMPVWTKFLDQNPTLFEKIYYNVRVGGIVIEDPAIDQKYKEAYYNVTAKRIDALCELKDEIWIVEVAVSQKQRAVGQLLSYLFLWYEDPVIPKKAVGVFVTQATDSDLERVLNFYGMRTRVVI